jgi:hypothetical protein
MRLSKKNPMVKYKSSNLKYEIHISEEKLRPNVGKAKDERTKLKGMNK